MWPFPKRTAPARFIPGLPYIDGERWATIGGTPSSITPQQAEALAAVLAAVNAVACTVASLPAYVTKASDAREEAPDHPLQRLINHGVNADESWSDFVEGLLASCLLRGNFLAEIQADTRGRVTGLRTLPWASVTPWMNDGGDLLFDFMPTLPPNAGKRRRYLREDVLFVKDRSDDGVIGRSRISRAAKSLQTAIQIETSSSQFMGNAARPAGTLTAPGRVSDATTKRLQEDWTGNYRGEGLGKVAILPEGLKWEPLSLMSAEDAQLVLHRNFSVADVARIFSVPPFMLADPSRATFASAREATRHFALSALLPWCRKIERAFSQSVLGSGFALKIDLDSLIKADIAELYSALLKGRQGGWLTANDARAETGFPAVADGNDITPPVSGGQPADPPPPAAGKVAPLFPVRHAAE
ncbi:MAG: phage portal protein [Reyranella sp.]